MSDRFKLVGITLLGICVLALSTAPDTFAAGSKKKDPLAWKPPTHIHMRPMMVPAGGTVVPMTFYLEATKRERTEDICKRMPRVRDAVLSSLSRNPVKVRKRKIILKGLDAQMLKPLNKAVGKKYIKKVYISKGAVRMGTGKIKRRPYAVIDGCENILRLEKERQQALKAQKEK
ncbi:MAG: hypothetical protein HOB37_06460 [Rhodospirillaceae bacterium]|nr:hypothetical protein [Rhodospirillaceae bacterium]MBT6086214.1 hypothetical protein [Rhodospirillaceae bacterium]MBT6608088.1 hypothetical protein [Rhodospirillaceae bacterium]